MGKSILKLLNFDINMTKFFASNSSSFTSSSSLQYISKLICTTVCIYLQYNIYLWCTVQSQCFYPQYLYIFLSIYLSTVFIYLLCLSVYRSFLLYSVSTVSNVQYLFFYSVHLSILHTAPFYLQCKAIFSALLSKDAFLSFLLCILLCLNIYTAYMYTLTFYLHGLLAFVYDLLTCRLSVCANSSGHHAYTAQCAGASCIILCCTVY